MLAQQGQFAGECVGAAIVDQLPRRWQREVRVVDDARQHSLLTQRPDECRQLLAADGQQRPGAQPLRLIGGLAV